MFMLYIDVMPRSKTKTNDKIISMVTFSHNGSTDTVLNVYAAPNNSPNIVFNFPENFPFPWRGM